jgi:hypothetical protein
LTQTEEVQLAAAVQSFPGAHKAQVPAQSTPPSVPFFTESAHVGVAQTPPVQTPLLQSPFTEHFLALAHFVVHVPPQSTSVSSPFCTVSLQDAALQTNGLPEQTPVVQSVPIAQVFPTSHLLHEAPPQSTAVSLPFFTTSEQVAT